MMSPTAPFKNKQLIWHLYSSQAYGMFHGDLGKKPHAGLESWV